MKAKRGCAAAITCCVPGTAGPVMISDAILFKTNQLRGRKQRGGLLSKSKHPWWGYVKAVIRLYPERCEQELHGAARREYLAVQAAAEQTGALPDGKDRLKVIELVLWKGTHLVCGAAMRVPCSERTAAQWHGDFIRLVARNLGLLD